MRLLISTLMRWVAARLDGLAARLEHDVYGRVRGEHAVGKKDFR